MRLLVLSDVHGNLEALDAILATEQTWSRVLVLGDLVGYGADPNAVVERVRALPLAGVVRGNHDKVAVQIDQAESFNPVARQAAEWTSWVLSADNRAWLAALPSGPLPFDDDVEFCHGAPFAEDFYVFDELDAQRAGGSTSRRLCLFGHTHVQGIFRLGAYVSAERTAHRTPVTFDYVGGPRALVNCGAVGQPRDGDPRAAYGLLDTDARTLTLARVAYDVERAQTKILAAGLPASLAQRLATGR